MEERWEVNVRCYLQERDAQCMFGLALYSLNRLYHSIKGHAEASGEWERLVALFLS